MRHQPLLPMPGLALALPDGTPGRDPFEGLMPGFLLESLKRKEEPAPIPPEPLLASLALMPNLLERPRLIPVRTLKRANEKAKRRQAAKNRRRSKRRH